jgi:hypothetical protein
LKIV